MAPPVQGGMLNHLKRFWRWLTTDDVLEPCRHCGEVLTPERRPGLLPGVRRVVIQEDTDTTHVGWVILVVAVVVVFFFGEYAVH